MVPPKDLEQYTGYTYEHQCYTLSHVQKLIEGLDPVKLLLGRDKQNALAYLSYVIARMKKQHDEGVDFAREIKNAPESRDALATKIRRQRKTINRLEKEAASYRDQYNTLRSAMRNENTCACCKAWVYDFKKICKKCVENLESRS